MTPKLNSMRWLEQNKIPYEVFEYPDSIRDAEEVAEVLGVPYFSLYKTLILEPINDPTQKKPFIVMLACDRQLDLKLMAKASRQKKVTLLAHKDAEAQTGLQVGGISALALRDKSWAVYLDSPATELQHIVISAGQRGLQLRVPVTPLVTLLKARIVDVSKPMDDEAD